MDLPPRVQRFVADRPEVRSCADLRALIDSFDSPKAFFDHVLDMCSPGKATMLAGVADYLLDIQLRFEHDTEDERLKSWARWARPGDYLAANVRGFKLAGFSTCECCSVPTP